MRVKGVLETSLYADDLEAAEEFYVGVMGLKVHSSREGRHVFFRCGTGMLLIFNALETAIVSQDEAPGHGCDGPGHVAFNVEASELDSWKAHFAARGVAIEREVERASGQKSIYFRDPSGNSLELASAALWGL